MAMTLLGYYQQNMVPMILTAGIFGMVFGSFLNVVIYRLPLMLQSRWKNECRTLLAEDQGQEPAAAETLPFNLVFPNSHCPHCGAPVRAWQNIPVISYVLLRGRCHECKSPISLRYPAVELLTGLAVALCASHWGLGWPALAASLFSCTLIALTMIDLDHQLLPDNLTLPLLWAGLVANSFGLFTELDNAVWGAVLGYLSLWSMYWLFKWITGKEGMGYGDFKLLAALGAWMGYGHLPLIIILSSLTGTVLAGLYLLRAKKGAQTRVPFGPFLAIAGWIALLYGSGISSWYLQYGRF